MQSKANQQPPPIFCFALYPNTDFSLFKYLNYSVFHLVFLLQHLCSIAILFLGHDKEKLEDKK